MPAFSPKALLSLDNIGKAYGLGSGQFQALRGVTLTVFSGEFIVILGPSGSGKSTLLNLLGGMDTISTGTLHYRSQDLGNATHRELTRYRRDEVGFIFQFYNLIPTLTALENIQIAVELAKNPMDAQAAIDLVGLKDFATHFPAQLSGGQQQRISIARALAGNPTMLLCDEPTGALDSQSSEQISDTLIDINKRLKKTIIMVTHNEGLAKNADRLIEIKDGKIESIIDNNAEG